MIVTAIVDLERQVGHSPTLREYVHLLRYVLDIGLPTIVYADPTIVDEITALPYADVQVIPATLETLPGFDEVRHRVIADVLEAGERPSTSTDPMKDTGAYITLQLLKPHLLSDAAQRVSADRLWWLDAGIAHACQVPANLRLTLTTTDMEDALILRDLRPGQRPQDWTAPDALGLASGGCFAVRASADQWFIETWDSAVDASLVNGIAALDEQILTAICIDHPQRVSVVSGWHQQLLVSLTKEPQQLEVPAQASPTSVRGRRVLPVERVVGIDLPIDIAPRWSLFNPSISADERGELAMIVRSSNYHLVRNQYDIVDGSQVIKTRNAFVRLHGDLTVRSARWIEDRDARVSTPSFPVEGLEDARLFRHDARWFLSAAYREHADSGAVRQLVATIETDGERVVLREQHVLHSPVAPGDLAARIYEKNWMPMPSDAPGRLRYVWGVDPLVIVEADLLTNHVVPIGAVPRRVHGHSMRGSSQVIQTPVGLLGVVHEVDEDVHHPTRPSRSYLHRFIRLDGDQCHLGPPWVLEEHGLEYVAGIALAGERLLVSYGRDDHEARIAECQWSDVLEFIPVD